MQNTRAKSPKSFVWFLAKPARGTENKAFVWVETQAWIWWRFPSEDFTMLACSAVVEILMGVLLIVIVDMIF